MKSTNYKPNEIRLPTLAEEILGIFLKDGKTFREHRLESAMFGEYAWLYKLMRKVDREEELTFRAIAGRCRDKVELLHALRNSVATVHTLPALVKNLRKEYLAKKLQEISYEIYERREEDPDDLLRYIQEKTLNLASSEMSDLPDPERDVDEWHDYVQQVIDDPTLAFGMMCGLEIDRITAGFQRTDFVVVGARTSMGKSAFMIELVLRLTKAGYKCAIFSLEMSKRQIYYRMMANLMGVDLKVLRTGQLAKERRHEITEHKELLKQIFVDDSRGVTADYITDMMRMLKRTRGLDFVVVDYIQDVSEPGEQNDNAGSAISRICRKLRGGAQQADCTVLGLSQVTRDVEKRENKRPTIADLSGSTGIETSADVIMTLYRDEYYSPNTSDQGILEVDIGKNRNGETGMVKLYYDKSRQRISNIAR